ncbi:uncharacterized protein A4U43_C08F5980 [Asparagus officinalis]|nr:uncharacterized protein A4U43_C08F5980 [Asparagus officinalis]
MKNTLKSPPPENQTMSKALRIAVFITAVFYLCCGCFGYAAFGNDTPGNLMTGFGFFEPHWIIDFANACIIIHLLGGYQVYSQPVYALVDAWLSERFPNNGYVNDFYVIKLPFLPSYRTNLLKLCYRTLYVISTTMVTIFFPYFNQVLGVLGAFSFWPSSIYFPVQMYFVQRNLISRTRKKVLLQMFCYGCLIISVFAFVGSVDGLLRKKFS